MKIVIIEDDALIAYQIESCVRTLGHDVLGSFDAASEALEFIAENKPDFVFMDIELNGPMDGIQCAGVLKHSFGVPSLFVTSHDETQVIAEATKLDPLNFLPKPFTDKNIEAAVALADIKLSHTKQVKEISVSQLGEYVFNFEHLTLKHQGTIVRLTPKELKLIGLLFKNLGNTVSNEEIRNLIWEGNEISSAAYRKLISRANENIAGLNIASDKGVGYYLEEL
ncbi:MAG TPA: response regulator transcription factor [Epsilonproteobacteria bacterium]|nr:response regulator transcription factor [Campylobacterota bacterium]